WSTSTTAPTSWSGARTGRRACGSRPTARRSRGSGATARSSPSATASGSSAARSTTCCAKDGRSRLLVQQALALRLPAQQPPRLREVELLLALVAADPDRVEAAAPDLHGVERREVGPRQVLLVGDVRCRAVVVRRVSPLLQVLLAGARPGDPEGDQVH